ncbi:ABC transporter permease subunit [Natronobacterium texcoconense]|uniref:ABC-2 type transport system permease protein n=1 Tax=Natronobacterium texcoconense TaxID=1095778 RepID=A0A1H1GXC5_NATTX|nr:ABC transporter permease subunit [Natronobacterium texcoconense]SDR17837.1 ABC-2 type transport system permease protein [Natronobacterium texcoconense]
MTWGTIAKKDFRDAVQSRALWAIVTVFVLVSLLSTYAYVEVPELFGEPGGATFAGLLFFTSGLLALFVPLTAVVVCYKSLAGERELGSIKLLLAQPTTRRDVFVGKVVGRAGVLAAGLGVGVVVGLGFGAALLGALETAAVVTFVLLTLAFTAVYAAIVVSLSATTGSTTRATTLALGFFVLFELLWDVVPVGLLYVVSGFSFPAEIPDWVFTVTQISPSSAYFSSLVALLPDLAGQVGADPGMDAGVGVEATTESGTLYASPEIGLVVLVLWLLVPTVVGYYQFRIADL